MNTRVSKKILHDCGKLKYSYRQLDKAFVKYMVHLRKVGNRALYERIMNQLVFNNIVGPLPHSAINVLNSTILKGDYDD